MNRAECFIDLDKVAATPHTAVWVLIASCMPGLTHGERPWEADIECINNKDKYSIVKIEDFACELW